MIAPPFDSLTGGRRLPRTALLQCALCITHRVDDAAPSVLTTQLLLAG